MRRRLSKRRLKRQRKFIILGSFVLLLGLSAGYAAFSTNISLNVKGNIKVTPDSCFIVSDNRGGTGTITDYDKSCGTKVKIPSMITYIYQYNFYGSQAKSVKLNEGLKYISSHAFGGGNNYFESIDIPSTVTYIESDTFYHNSNLKVININTAEGSLEEAPWGASGATVNWTN